MLVDRIVAAAQQDTWDRSGKPERTGFLTIEWGEKRMAKATVDPRYTIERLEQQHRTLKEQVAHLERRAFLTPTEQREATSLKKQKLATKDAISQLRARLN
jgi:uncharacterized protein YdcH (DUF465 family)